MITGSIGQYFRPACPASQQIVLTEFAAPRVAVLGWQLVKGSYLGGTDEGLPEGAAHEPPTKASTSYLIYPKVLLWVSRQNNSPILLSS